MLSWKQLPVIITSLFIHFLLIISSNLLLIHLFPSDLIFILSLTVFSLAELVLLDMLLYNAPVANPLNVCLSLADLDFVFLALNPLPTNECTTYFPDYLNRQTTIISFLLFLKSFVNFFATNRSGLGSNEEVLNTLVSATNEALLSFFDTYFNCTPGFVSVIHTFGAKLNRNPHVHYIVTA